MTTLFAALIVGCSGSNASKMPAGAATIPADLHCADAIVWVDPTAKVYHLPGDMRYGMTTGGDYECRATADGRGFRLAGMPREHTGWRAPASQQPSPAPR